MNDANNDTHAPEAEIIKPEAARVEVSAEMLNDALIQLRKLTEIRQREAERQERAIAQMQKAIKRQGILSRYVILTSSFALVLVIGLGYIVHDAGRKTDIAANTLLMVEKSVSDANQTIAAETRRQAEGLAGLEAEILSSRESQAGLLKKVDEQLGAVREERDQVRGEVRHVLEEKTREITGKELALAAEREAIAEAAKRSKEEQKALIQQTIDRLTAMSATLVEAPPPQETPAPEEPVISIEAAPDEAEIPPGTIEQSEEAPPSAPEPAAE